MALAIGCAGQVVLGQVWSGLRAAKCFVWGTGTLSDLQSSLGSEVLITFEWHGPDPVAVAPFSKEYVQDVVKGRGDKRVLNHIVVHVD
eukprot:12825788-Heterocapsa_arctica.AAC.1